MSGFLNDRIISSYQGLLASGHEQVGDCCRVVPYPSGSRAYVSFRLFISEESFSTMFTLMSLFAVSSSVITLLVNGIACFCTYTELFWFQRGMAFSGVLGSHQYGGFILRPSSLSVFHLSFSEL